MAGRPRKVVQPPVSYPLINFTRKGIQSFTIETKVATLEVELDSNGDVDSKYVTGKAGHYLGANILGDICESGFKDLMCMSEEEYKYLLELVDGARLAWKTVEDEL